MGTTADPTNPQPEPQPEPQLGTIPSADADGRRDVVVIGAGIVGLATARALLVDRPGLRLTLVDKEPTVAAHQTGRNSGVIHSGIYYKPGSLKAKMAVAGADAMVAFCREHGVDYEVCGKVIVATAPDELDRLEELHRRGNANGVPNRHISRDELRDREPYVAGIAALEVESTGIVDYPGVCERLRDLIVADGGDVRLGVSVDAITPTASGAVVHTSAGEITADVVVNCAGLFCDRVARSAGAAVDVRIVPFRGEYFELVPDRRHLVRHLVYPVPDPAFPFLGVHFTRMVGGGLECGPNAVLALAREGYTWADIDLRDLRETLTWPGVWTIGRKYWRTEVGEVWRSASKAAFVKALQRLVPAVEVADLERVPSGVRAQAVARDGSLLDDFSIVSDGPCIHILNAPSPAATAALPIGAHVAGLVRERTGV